MELVTTGFVLRATGQNTSAPHHLFLATLIKKCLQQPWMYKFGSFPKGSVHDNITERREVTACNCRVIHMDVRVLDKTELAPRFDHVGLILNPFWEVR